jgi:hypothetical protein
LTAQGLRRLVLNLEKRYTRNQELRIKYAGQPDKYDPLLPPPSLLCPTLEGLGAQTLLGTYVRPT